MLATVIPRFLADDSFAGYIGIAVDITDLKHNQEQLRHTKAGKSGHHGFRHRAQFQQPCRGRYIAEADLALLGAPPDSPAHGNVEQINAIAMRAADIVYVLTAYASFGPAGEVMSLAFLCSRRGPSTRKGHCLEEYCILGNARQKTTAPSRRRNHRSVRLS